MRIRTFCKYIEMDHLEKTTLKNCSVVVDGQNFLYDTYKDSKLPYEFGCEADKYAIYLKNYLKMFNVTNIKCYFFFKGRKKNILEKVDKSGHSTGQKYVIGEDCDDIVSPIFTKEVYKEVLSDLGIKYVFCEYEAKEDICAFAQKHNYPVISYDIEYCFLGVHYIPSSSIQFDVKNNELQCGVFKLTSFLKNCNLTKEKLAIFITLTNENVYDINTFVELFDSLNLSKAPYRRNYCLLKWLARLTVPHALGIIYKYVDKKKFDEELENSNKFICKKMTNGVAGNYLEDKNSIQIYESDPEWFKKGLALGHISKFYTNLYYSGVMFGSWAIEDKEADDSLLCSIEIIKYAFNLLTNFNKKEFLFVDKRGNKHSIVIIEKDVFRKPHYKAIDSPFEKGWNNLKDLSLFEFFLETTLPGHSFECLLNIPEEFRLLMISLIYYSRQKHFDTTNIICSVLLSSILLNKFFEQAQNITDGKISNGKLNPLRSSSKNINAFTITEQDFVMSQNILKGYFNVTQSETHCIFDRKLVHNLVEYQFCLLHLNYLNSLCGSPYKSTVYSKTYNGTFVYKFLHAIENDGHGDGIGFVNNMIGRAPTVLTVFKSLFKIYENFISE